MDAVRPGPLPNVSLLPEIEQAIERAAAAMAATQQPDGNWVFELEADCTIPAEYVLLRHFLGEPIDAELEAKIARYLRRIQSAEHDGWGLFHSGGFDVSASIKAYYALKMIGDRLDAPHMARARAAILAAGGAAAGNVFTRIQLALFEAGPWSSVPTLPPELILLPRSFPIHLSKMSYWARTVVVPLLVLCAVKPKARNRLGIRVDELYTGRPAPLESRAAETSRVWTIGFNALDRVLKLAEGLWPRLRARALGTCIAWVDERLNGLDGLGAIYPAMANSVMMYDCLGIGPDEPRRAAARESVERLLVVSDDEAYCQPCVSPVWDTALAAHAMLEAGDALGATAGAELADRALAWLKPRQVLGVAGDWAEERPGVRPGGWAFQYGNDHYPDLDDTAVVVMAMDRAQRRGGDYREAIARGAEWTVGLQSKDGGWGAFDADNAYLYLNNLPFADHGALLDPPTADVTARCVSMLAQLGETDTPQMRAALAWLERAQEADGSWFGRWGVNYIYGTWSVLCALNAAGLPPEHPMVARAVGWLAAIQNPDGGWGEDCDSYALGRLGHTPAASTASQTAWAVLGLMAAGEVHSEAVARGVGWLTVNQQHDGLWGQEMYTGGGFPRVFYLRYHGYPKYFPLWALARYRNLSELELGARGVRDVTRTYRMSGHVVVATGFNREAATVRQPGAVTVVGGGDPAALRARIEAAAAGAAGILSYGMTGALVDGLAIGDWVIGDRLSGAIDVECDPAWAAALREKLRGARIGGFFADGRMIDTVAEKLALGERHGALAVDMESHVAGAVAAARDLPFAILRCVSDGARHLLPHAITVAMRPDGGVNVGAVLRSLAARPAQIVDVARSSAGFAKAMREMARGAARVGPRMALP